HTRFSLDWSSDVCSSDLPYLSGQAPPAAAVQQVEIAAAMPDAAQSTPSADIAAEEAAPRALDVQAEASDTPVNWSGLHILNADRSEARRVETNIQIMTTP